MNPKRKMPWGKLLVALALLIVAAAAYQKFSGGEKKTEYETSKVEKRTVEAFVSATGSIESTTTVTVGSQVSGPVSQVLVDFNSPVTAGQILARIDPSEFIARQAQSQASLQSATAGRASAVANLAGQDAAVQQAEVAIVTARVSLDQTQGTVQAARAGVATAKANLESRKIEVANNLVQYKRAEDLVARELVALSDRDAARTSYLVSSSAVATAEAGVQQARAQQVQAEAQLEGARNDIRAAEARLASAQAQRKAAVAQVSAAEATVAQAQAGVAQAAVDLERTDITSPISGVVINRKVDEGQTVAAQFTAPELFTIARDLGQMQVKAEVSEADIGRVVEGAPVKFTVDAYPGREFNGSVIQVRSAPDVDEKNPSNVVVYGVMVTAANPDKALKPGMTATVEILAEKLKDAVVLPSQALRYVPSSEGKDDAKKGKGKGKKKAEASASPSPSGSATPGTSPSPNSQDVPKPKEEKLAPGTRKGAVWVLKDGKPKRVDIVTGISTQDDVVVVSGDVKAGDEVILSEDTGEGERSRFRLSF